MTDVRSGTGNLEFGDSAYNTAVGRAADFRMTPRGTNYTPRTRAHVDPLVELAELGALPPAIVAQAVMPPLLRSTGRPVSTSDPASAAQYHGDLAAARALSPAAHAALPRAPRQIPSAAIDLQALRRPPQPPGAAAAVAVAPAAAARAPVAPAMFMPPPIVHPPHAAPPDPASNPHTILSFMRQLNARR